MSASFLRNSIALHNARVASVRAAYRSARNLRDRDMRTLELNGAEIEADELREQAAVLKRVCSKAQQHGYSLRGVEQRIEIP